MKKSILLPTLVSSMVLVLSACGGGSSDSGAKDPDTEAPVITIIGGNVQLDQGAAYTDAGATAEDNIDETVVITTNNNVDTSVVATHTVTYTAVDEAGNESTAVRSVTVNDVTAPVITVNAGADSVNQGDTFIDASATAVDNVDGNISISTSNDVDTSVVGTHTVTYTATDAAGNTSTAIRTVTVNDVTAPVISVIGGTATVVEGDEYTDAGANAVDAVDGNVAVFATNVNTSIAGNRIVTYTAVDAAGNSAIAERNVRVIRPSTFNTFDGTWRGNCLPTSVLPGATAATQEFVLVEGKLVNNVKGYVAGDCSGATLYDATAEADVIFRGEVNAGVCIAERVDSDITSAVINGEEQNLAEIQDFIDITGYPLFNLFCLNQNGKLLGGRLSSGDGKTEETRPTEMASSQAQKFTQVDTMVPQITMIGNDSFTINVGTTYVDAGVIATDDQDGDLTASVITTGSVDTSVADTYEIVYSVSDAEGNTTTAKRTVKVVRGPNTFTAFDGEWQSDCISNSNAALAAVGVRAFNKTYVISNDVNLTLVNGFTASNCSGTPNYLGNSEVDIVYSGEIDEAACASGKAEKVDLTVTQATINNGLALSNEDLSTFLEATEFPTFNLLCIDASGDLREGNVVGPLNGLKESKRPDEIDLTGSGLVLQP